MQWPRIGQGTWGMGESRADRTREVEALRLGIALGLTLIDTAEFYAAGRAEAVVGDAVHDCRTSVVLVTKLWPSHAGRRDVWPAVRASLRRLRTDYLDMVLLHWPTRSVPLAETLAAFAELRAAGVVQAFGVSNFDLAWLERAAAALPPGERLACNQVRYSLRDRRAERAVLPYARRHGQVVMAYSPLGHGRLAAWPGFPQLARIAARRGVSPHQVALAWVADQPGVVAIPKAVQPAHVRDNAAAASLVLTPAERDAVAAAFPLPLPLAGGGLLAHPAALRRLLPPGAGRRPPAGPLAAVKGSVRGRRRAPTGAR
jgi:diketogulonate reductase-like aldo/keto reductase